MQQNNMTSIRAMLEQMPTHQLDEMLQTELDKEPADGNAVRLILDILREREKDDPVEITPGVEQAWEKYQKDIAAMDAKPQRARRIQGWMLRVASVTVVVCLLAAVIPQTAQAETFWEKLVRWTSGIVEFFSPEDNEGRVLGYEFQTDNPGLQQLHDAVVEIGVTVPVVPMWIPEGGELLECKQTETSRKKGILATFVVGNTEMIYKLDCYDEEYLHKYHRDETTTQNYEKAGIDHSITRNNDRWVVFWYRDYCECFITIDCQEDELYQILESIYVMEGK